MTHAALAGAGAVAVALVAAGLAAADGALLAIDRDPPAAPDALAPLRQRHEAARRAVSLARLLAHLATGVLLGMALAAAEARTARDLVALVAAVLAVALLSETAPRAWGERRGVAVLPRLLPLVRAAEVVLAPAAAIAGRLDAWLAGMIPPAQPDEEEREATAEQFREVIAAEADVTRDEKAILHGVFSLGDTEVHEVMVPRVDMVGIARESPWSEVVDRVRSSEHSRFPIYEDTIDDVLGVLHAKDLLPFILAEEPPAAGWPSLLRPASFIPRTKLIGDQLRDFRATGSHIAIVVDEYGGTAGLVTIEDVLEELVGEIRDEHDEEEPEVEARDGRRYWVAGRVTLEELCELTGQEFVEEEVTTVGGLVYAQLGRVPRAGESFTRAGFRVVVERVRRRRVERVYFERLESPEEDA
ncbi:MAG TPA: hemolysin family protein [Gemmatimonadaceae bacterium]|nr:hemolysin family protein [Gemmatimonadaceae bacterium]